MNSARKLIDDLASVDLIKTWSLIVTMLGDLSGHSAASFSGKEISTILGHIGIRPEATRVALHRLKKDGWIDTTKVGREVIYQLSKDGLSQTREVYEDVYRENVKFPDGWKLILNTKNEPDTDDKKLNGIILFKNVSLVPNATYQLDDNSMELGFDMNNIPVWFGERIVQPKILEVTKQLNEMAIRLERERGFSSQLDSVAVRILFLHHWRKMALRDNTWAHIWLFKNGPISHYHKHIISILKLLPSLNCKRLDLI